ncbi:helix-turn-helix domain-containing protein [Chryseobacterium sp. RP-3-3]|uniref:Helix-turn-helix domain-containing protein n=1 Tax=Chryseobacterium antibioticum TaxID=2728847 RepID=A0A7Y0AL25_9FLAO|nr:helix-turn-helix domain-containing protein [Chryseobacterium antibioticum]NML69137.1 helix-turn-helix domain-containing protein [Chryseobacterium antibioticum]
MEKMMPNYKLIYGDIIKKKYPHKKLQCHTILNKEQLSVLDVIKLNDIIFDSTHKEAGIFNQMLRSYDQSAILEILDYQKANKLNNTQLALEFKLSRNSISKWKKIFVA